MDSLPDSVVRVPVYGGRKNSDQIVGYALVDSNDLALVSTYRWNLNQDGYVVGRRRGEGTRSKVRMHRLIMGFPPTVIDHENRITYDNRRSNLRVATRGGNAVNTGLRADNTSGYKGVSWMKHSGKWRASICYEGKAVHIGVYTSVEEAAKAYDGAAIYYFGEFASLNFSTNQATFYSPKAPTCID